MHLRQAKKYKMVQISEEAHHAIKVFCVQHKQSIGHFLEKVALDAIWYQELEEDEDRYPESYLEGNGVNFGEF